MGLDDIECLPVAIIVPHPTSERPLQFLLPAYCITHPHRVRTFPHTTSLMAQTKNPGPDSPVGVKNTFPPHPSASKLSSPPADPDPDPWFWFGLDGVRRAVIA